MTHFLWKNIIKYKLIKKITHPVVKVSKKRLKLLKKYPKGFVISKKTFRKEMQKILCKNWSFWSEETYHLGIFLYISPGSMRKETKIFSSKRLSKCIKWIYKSMMQIASQRSENARLVQYGNTGCGVFKRGVHN